MGGACPQAIDVEVYIKAHGDGSITYQPETSDLGLVPKDTIIYNSAGTDTEFFTWTIEASGNYWLKVHIPDLNNLIFGPYNMIVNCQ
jgi:glycine cleavage system aminomethyltransferase T